MPKTWEPTRRGVRDLTNYIRQNGKGTTVYTVATHRDWGLGAEQTYSAHTFTHTQPITGIWQAGHLSPHALLSGFGRVYADPPRGIRNSADPAPQVAGPLGRGDYSGYLDEAEIRGLGKRVRSGSDPATRPSHGRRH